MTWESGLGVWKGELIRRLGEAGCGRENGRVGSLDLLARAGFPVPAGVVLTRRAHELFLWTSGTLRDIVAAAPKAEKTRQRTMKTWLRRASISRQGELNRAICEALIGLHAESVVVLSEDLERHTLRSIPEVRDAILDAWLSPRGLERQLAAVARGEDIPTWPVLAQRQAHPTYTRWAAAGEGSGSIADLTAEAAAVLGEPVSIRWGLHEGRWYVLSASLSGEG